MQTRKPPGTPHELDLTRRPERPNHHERAMQIRDLNQEGRMSGFMVTTTSSSHRNVYMLNTPDPDRACAEIEKLFGPTTGVHVLSEVSDDTLAHHNVKPGSPWICFTMRQDTGKITAHGFSDAATGGRVGTR